MDGAGADLLRGQGQQDAADGDVQQQETQSHVLLLFLLVNNPTGDDRVRAVSRLYYYFVHAYASAGAVHYSYR